MPPRYIPRSCDGHRRNEESDVQKNPAKNLFAKEGEDILEGGIDGAIDGQDPPRHRLERRRNGLDVLGNIMGNNGEFPTG